MEVEAHGQRGLKCYPGSVMQGQELCVCAAAINGLPNAIRPTGPLHHTRPVRRAWGLCHVASLGDIPGNS